MVRNQTRPHLMGRHATTSSSWFSGTLLVVLCFVTAAVGISMSIAVQLLQHEHAIAQLEEELRRQQHQQQPVPYHDKPRGSLDPSPVLRNLASPSLASLSSFDSSLSRRFPTVDCRRHIHEIHQKTPDKGGDWNQGQLFAKLAKVKHPFWISLHNETVDVVRWPMFSNGIYYEDLLTHAFEEILNSTSNKDALVIDIGGNIGWFTLVSAALGHDVYVFEPNPMNQYRLCQSLILNQWLETSPSKNYHTPTSTSDKTTRALATAADSSPRHPTVRMFPYGVGAVSDTSPMVGLTPGSMSFRDARNRYDGTHGHRLKEVTIVTLDDVAAELQWISARTPIALLKIDVEGYEPQAMTGARTLLHSGLIQNILMEISHMGNLTHVENMLDDIGHAGYHLHKVGKARGPGYEPKPGVRAFDTRVQARGIIDLLIKEQDMQANLWWRLPPRKLLRDVRKWS